MSNSLINLRGYIQDILNEGKNPIEAVKYYFKAKPELMDKLFKNDNFLLKKLASLDIEYNPEKLEVGKIFPWILNLWKNGDPTILNFISNNPNGVLLTKFKNGQKLFQNNSFKKRTGISDIQKFKNIESFLRKVGEEFINPDEISFLPSYNFEELNKDIQSGIIAKTNLSNDNYFIIRPLTKKGACKYGNLHNMENVWCTAKNQDNAFDNYKDGNLYIFMDIKDNFKSKYQLYIYEDQIEFRNENNNTFDYKKFFNKNIDLFNKLFPKVVEVLTQRDIKSDENFIKTFTAIKQFLPDVYLKIVLKNYKKLVGNFLKSLIDISERKIDPELYFSDSLEEKIGFDFYDVEIRKNEIIIDCNIDDIGSESNDEQNGSNLMDFYRGSKYYDNYEFQSEEYEYLANFIKDEDRDLWIGILKTIDKNFKDDDFNKDGKIIETIEGSEVKNYFEELLIHFANNYEEAINKSQTLFLKSVIKDLPFEMTESSLIFNYSKIAKYCISNDIIDPASFYDIFMNTLSDLSINYDNYNDYYENDIDYSKLKKQLSSDINSIRFDIEDLSNLSKVAENLKKILKDLKFDKSNSDVYSLETKINKLLITGIDVSKNSVFLIYYNKKTRKQYSGWVSIDDIAKYTTTPMLFELRNKIRKEIKFNYK